MSRSRREFIKAAALAGCLPFCGISGLAYEESVNRKHPLLVILFLRGGMDGLHVVAPSADPHYIQARPPELRVAEAGENSGYVLDGALDASAGFKLHPAAGALADLYRGGELAIVHAVGLNDGTRSHFVAQDLIERGLVDEKFLHESKEGWLTRLIGSARPLSTTIPAYSASSVPALSLSGGTQPFSAPELAGGVGFPWGPVTGQVLRAFSREGQNPVDRATIETLDLLETIDKQLPKDAQGRVLPYAPAGKARYEGAGDLARTLASVARLSRMEVGLQLATVDFGGWDTHESQGGKVGALVKQLSLGMAAFREDMAAAKQPFVLVGMTEFGRRLRANKSGGTDHGHGGCWMVLGDSVRGKKMYGRWPGLATPQLDQGVDLAVTTDYRQVLAEVVRPWNIGSQRLFPGFAESTPLGLLA
ncbi:MAG TPA: DUF1501 domain-containing protein [Accumulibacter sp.]|nr:DUF1501 domain-containing protein [Accumulibacter sp.]HMW17217.1 DUF1501 domain-containing protein [Accumulibacter sp.]HMX23191.1 DUF1501 domain-containing protein [Accumulibacter sp.]HMY05949.1 DUF1501 domain-containing protein [Accumulibacter sp.]HNC18951.1 DUF1501 domain-containing protein [Accumulibacter sp.]